MTGFHSLDLQERIAVRKGLRTNGIDEQPSDAVAMIRRKDAHHEDLACAGAGFPERGKADGAVAVHHREERHFPTAVDIILRAFRQTEPIRQGEKNVGGNGRFFIGGDNAANGERGHGMHFLIIYVNGKSKAVRKRFKIRTYYSKSVNRCQCLNVFSCTALYF